MDKANGGIGYYDLGATERVTGSAKSKRWLQAMSYDFAGQRYLSEGQVLCVRLASGDVALYTAGLDFPAGA